MIITFIILFLLGSISSAQQTFQPGDKWVYQKKRAITSDTTFTYIVKELIDHNGTLLVKEFPGNNSWTERWEVISDSAFITFTINTLGYETRLKIYNGSEKNYYQSDAQGDRFNYNKSGEFLDQWVTYQHRMSYGIGYFRIPTPTKIETKYSREIGLVYLFYHRSSQIEIWYNDEYILKAAKIGDSVYGDEIYIKDLNSFYDNDHALLLNQNYPNPFNLSTKIQYGVLSQSFVSLNIYNTLGELLTNLVNEEKPAGLYSVEFNAVNLTSGIYIYTLSAGTTKKTRKLILIK